MFNCIFVSKFFKNIPVGLYVTPLHAPVWIFVMTSLQFSNSALKSTFQTSRSVHPISTPILHRPKTDSSTTNDRNRIIPDQRLGRCNFVETAGLDPDPKLDPSRSPVLDESKNSFAGMEIEPSFESRSEQVITRIHFHVFKSVIKVGRIDFK